MKTLIAALAIAVLLAVPAQATPRDDAYVACMIGNAGVSLHKQLGPKRPTAAKATNIAYKYAAARCKSSLSTGGDDYIYHSTRAMAEQWF